MVDYSVVIRASINTENVDEQIKNIQKKINGTTLRMNVDVNQIDNLNKKIDEISRKIRETNSQQGGQSVISENAIKSTNHYNRLLERTLNIYKEQGKEIIKVTSTIDPLTNKMTGFTARVREANNVVKDLSFKLGQVDSSGAGSPKMEGFELTNIKETQTNIREIEERIKRFVTTSEDNLSRLRKRFGDLISPELNTKLKQYQSELNNLSPSTEDLDNKMKNMTTGFKSMETEAKNSAKAIDVSNRTMMSFSQAMKTALVKFPIWVASAALIYAPIRAFRDAIQQIIEIDSKITVLRRVMDETSNFNGLLLDSVRLSKELGNTVSQILDGMTGFARQGYTEGAITELTRVATLMSNVSDLTVEDSMSRLTGNMQVFRLTANEAIRVADSLNEVDNNFAITTKDIADAMAKSAAVANAFGVTMEELVGHISAIGITTRESGAIIGNSLKTIYSRITTMQPSIDALSRVGINVRDSVGNMKPVTDILEELAYKWNSLNAETQQNLAVTLAGRFQLSRFLVLMQQHSLALDVTNTALNSQNSAMRENQKYLESYEAKLNLLKNSWTEVILASQEAVLGDGLNAAIGTMDLLAKSISSVVSKLGLLPPIIIAVNVALVIFTKTARELNFSIGFGLINYIYEATGKLKGLERTLKATTISAKMLYGALGMFLTGFSFFLIEKLISKYGEMIEKSRKLAEEEKRVVEQYTRSGNAVRAYVEEYRKLSNIKQADKTDEMLEREKQILQEINTLMPDLVDSIDEKGNIILKNNEYLDLTLEYMEKLTENAKELSSINFSNNMNELSEEVDKTNKKLEKTMQLLEKGKAVYVQGVPVFTEISSEERLDALNQQARYEQDLAQAKEKQIDLVRKEIETRLEISGIYDNLIQSDKELLDNRMRNSKTLENDIDSLTNIMTRLSGIREVVGDTLSTNLLLDNIDVIERLTNQFSNGEITLEEYKNGIRSLNASALDMVNVSNRLTGIIDEQNKKLDASSFAALEAIQSNMELGNSLDNLSGKYSDIISEIDEWRKIQQELTEQGELSIETIAKMIDKHEDFKDVLFLGKDAIASYIQEKKLSTLETIKANKEATRSSIESTKIQIDNIAKEIEAINLLNVARISSLMTRTEIERRTTGADQFDSLFELGKLKNMLSELEFNYDFYDKILEKFQTRANTPMTDGSSSGGMDRIFESTLERYIELKNTVNRLNNEISLNQLRLGVTSDEQERLSFLEKLNEQYKEQQKNIGNFAIAIREERDEIQKLLKSQNFEFSGSGDEMIISNLRDIEIQSQETQNAIQRFYEIQGSELPSLQQQWWGLQQSIKGNTSEIEDLRKAYLDMANSLADDVISAYKDYYKKQRDLLINAQREELKILEETHKREMALLDEKLRKYNEIINAKLKEIDQAEDERNFSSELTKAQEERQKIISEINLRSLDDSLESRVKITELNEELSKKDEEIEEMMHRRTISLRKENLKDKLDGHTKEVNMKKSAAEAEIDEERRKTAEIIANEKWKYDELINNERMFAQMRTDIIRGNLDEIKNEMQGFLDEFKNYNEETVRAIGLSWQNLNNIIDTVRGARDGLQNFVPQYEQPKGAATGQAAIDNEKRLVSDPNFVRDEISRAQSVIAGMKVQGLDTTVQENYLERLRKMASSFDTGGYTGSFSGGKMAVLHEKEIVLNKQDTKNLLDIINISRGLINGIKGMTGINNPKVSTPNNINMEINIASLTGDENGARNLFSIIRNELSSKGLR